MTEPSEFDYLDVEDLLEIAAGVLTEIAVRDLGLLASAAARPRTTVFGEDAYPGLAAKAAALLHSIARNHALVDGNKRLAWSAARIFCLIHRRDLAFSVDEAERMVLDVACGGLDLPDLMPLIDKHLA